MTTMHHLATAGYEKRKHLFTADFPNAYLKVDRSKHDMPREFTRLTGKLARLVCEEQPEYKQYLHQGCLFLEIMRSVYGLTESAALRNKNLSCRILHLCFSKNDFSSAAAVSLVHEHIQSSTCISARFYKINSCF